MGGRKSMIRLVFCGLERSPALKRQKQQQQLINSQLSICSLRYVTKDIAPQPLAHQSHRQGLVLPWEPSKA